MPAIAELGSIPTFVVPEVFSHQGRLAYPIEACDFIFYQAFPYYNVK